MRTITLDGWTLFSQRNNSSNYISNDGQWILKIPTQNAAVLNDSFKESEITKLAMQFGIKTPAFKELVQIENGSIAVINQYIKDKKSYARAMMEDRSRTDALMKNFAKEAKIFHSTDADTRIMQPYTGIIANGLKNSSIFSENEQDYLLNQAEKINHANKCLHGDFHPSNIICNDTESYFIDLGYFSYGDPMFDLGFFWYVVNYSVDVVYERVLHAPKEEAIHQFQTFAKYYFDCDDIKSIENDLRPYGLLSALTMLTSFPTDEKVKENKELILKL